MNWDPADLKRLVRFAERRNLVSVRVPSHFKRSLLPPGEKKLGRDVYGTPSSEVKKVERLILIRIKRDVVINVHVLMSSTSYSFQTARKKLYFLDRFSNNDQKSNLIKIRPLEACMFHADGGTGGRYENKQSLFAILGSRLKCKQDNQSNETYIKVYIIFSCHANVNIP
jgi:hypothetical protein